MTLYEYAPLDSSRHEIRILRFTKPGTSGRVQCILQHVSLDALSPAYEQHLQEHKPATPIRAVRGWTQAHHTTQSWEDTEVQPIEIDAWRYSSEYRDNALVHSVNRVLIPPRFEWGDFEAISYCWESNVRDRELQVDGKVIRVTSNLEALLQELQQLPEALSGMGFWVDGLCINQDDTLEKNSQVSLMSRIYSQAMSTVAWLGLSTPSSNVAIDKILESFGDDRLDIYENDWEDYWTSQNPTSTNLFPVRYWSSIIDLCSRQYFRRMWIIQELALNKNMTMFMCGNRRFSRASLQGMCTFARTNEEGIATALHEHLVQDGLVRSRNDFIWSLSNDVSNLVRLRQPADLDELLDLVRKAGATDRRDKIYGMLGLLPQDIAAQIQPDYTKSREEVFMDFATSVLCRCQRLDELLSWCVFNEASTAPSWIPDWGTTHNRRLVRIVRGREAGGGDSAKWSLCRYGRGLRVKAVQLGQVESVSLQTRSLLPHKVTARPRAPKAHTSPQHGRYSNVKELSMALDRTLMLDHHKTRKGGPLTDLRWIDWNVEGESNLEWDGFLSDRYSHFDRFRQSNAEFLVFGVALRDLFAGVNDPDPLANFTADGNVKHHRLTSRRKTSPHIDNLKRASIALQHRRLCTTQTGFLCLAPDEVKIGDSIAILLGCNYPVLLRPFEDGYKYVGECYVDGMMNGEAVKAADHGKCKVEDTVLL